MNLTRLSMVAAAGLLAACSTAPTVEPPAASQPPASSPAAAPTQGAPTAAGEPTQGEGTQASAAAAGSSASPPQVIDWSSSTVSPYTPPAPPVPAGMARVVMEVDTPDGRATMADLTVGEGGKISQHEGVDVPLTMKSDGRRGLALVRPIGEFVQLTAQNRMGSGSISCRILASDGSVISENVSSGGYVVVGCQGRAR